MARYTGPKRKLERREQTTLFRTNKWEKRPGAPGQHAFKRGRPSEYATQLREVQKVKRMYGILEKQFSNMVKEAQKSTGNTGTRLLQITELRLDNIVYRLNYASTRAQARQFVTHGHVKVNGKKLDICSARVNVGDEIELSDKIKKSDAWPVIEDHNKERNIPEWLKATKKSGKLVSVPQRSELDQNINERLIIEFYSR